MATWCRSQGVMSCRGSIQRTARGVRHVANGGPQVLKVTMRSSVWLKRIKHQLVRKRWFLLQT